MVGVGSQTRKAFTNFSIANTKDDSNGGSSEGTFSGWTGGKSLKDLGAGHAPREEIS